jgi:hypothetical protein
VSSRRSSPGDPEAAQLGLQAVAAALAAGQAGGEDHAVVGERGGRGAVGGDGDAELGEDDLAGDPVVGGAAQGAAGVVIEPGQDLGARPVSQRVVREAGLPALVRLAGGEPDTGRAGALARFGVTSPARDRYRLIAAAETRAWWRRCRCQAIVCGPASRPWPASSLRSLMIRPAVASGIAAGLVRGRRDRGSNAASPPARYRASSAQTRDRATP